MKRHNLPSPFFQRWRLRHLAGGRIGTRTTRRARTRGTCSWCCPGPPTSEGSGTSGTWGQCCSTIFDAVRHLSAKNLAFFFLQNQFCDRFSCLNSFKFESKLNKIISPIFLQNIFKNILNIPLNLRLDHSYLLCSYFEPCLSVNIPLVLTRFWVDSFSLGPDH
jgi:hypothetical protein